MTAHDLARQLLALPDLPVYLDGYEGGIAEAEAVREIVVHLDYWHAPDVHDPYMGAHEVAEAGSPGVSGIYLPRNS